jgi:hypothetical protein
MPNALSMHIEESVGKLGKAMIDGKVKYHLVEPIITLEPLILNGMPRQFMVRMSIDFHCTRT